MYQVIARKYRPAKFSELISQEHVRTTLENAIKQQRIAHGYILSGQRGTGKTTVARIIARCLNCINGPTPQPCGECASCREIAEGSSVDVIEIDAASNRGINEMRELRDNVRYRPARDRYKVFIVDEAHQITSEAFNALLKTLEEPPEWVVFILCTTESHKIPVTIASRCQQFSFRSVDFAELVARMRWICQEEGIQADDDVLGVIAQVGEGSVRDSLSALDQAIACCGTTLSEPGIRDLLGLFSLESLQHVAEALERGDAGRMIEIVQELERTGHSLHHFCRELARYIRNLLVAKISGDGETRLISASAAEQGRLRETASRFTEEDLTRYLQLVLDLYKDMQSSLQPRLHLEMGLLRLVHAGKLLPIEQALSEMRQGQPSKPARASPPPRPAAEPPKARSGPSPFALDSARKTSSGAAAAAPAPERNEPKSSIAIADAPEAPRVAEDADARSKLLKALIELGYQFTADAIEHSEVTEAGADLNIVAPKEFASSLSMSESQIRKAAEQAFGRALRTKITAGNPVVQQAAATAPKKASTEDELMQRALADPAVQRFREAFPNAEIRQVRDLKEQS
jgi:DNA polymerase III subunit gamma/tau